MIKYILAAILSATSLIASAEEQIIALGTANTVNFRGEVSDSSADAVAKELLRLNDVRGSRDYPIYLIMDSPGGSIMAGENFIEVTKSIKNLHTITVFAASMASAIVQAIPGNRYILSSGVLMFHRAKGQVSGQFETGELETRLDFYKSFVRNMEVRNANRMGISLKQYKSYVLNEYWMAGPQSVERNAADAVVGISCTKKLRDKIETIDIDMFIFRIKVEFSACPLIKTGQPAKSEPQEKVELYYKYKPQIGVIQ